MRGGGAPVRRQPRGGVHDRVTLGLPPVFVPFGLADPGEIVRSRRAQLRPDVEFRLAEVERVEPTSNIVFLDDGEEIPYDVLVIATGASLAPEETDGLQTPQWGRSIHTFYTLDGAVALRDALAALTAGHLVVDVVDMPIKCPVAPLEFCFLADWQLREHGLRDDVEITLVTPLDGAFTRPTASARLGRMLEDRRIRVEAEFATGCVDGDARRVHSFDERAIDYDLLVVVPVHTGAPCIARSPGLGDPLGFVAVNRHTLQCEAADNVFCIGDAADVPTSKAGSVTHFEADTLAGNIRRFLNGDPLVGSYDGHANCFIETGFHKALMIDFNYEQEPLPGRYPEPHIGPLPLLAESRLNHLAKLAFQPLYWSVLLPGHDIPGVGARMRAARVPSTEKAQAPA